jgi:NADH:ubiquinone oxidoreductase subunit D
MIQETIKIGPVDARLPGHMILSLGMQGDVIESVETEFGFSSRNIIELMKVNELKIAAYQFSHLSPNYSFIMDSLMSELRIYTE